jgi:acetyl esterase/lipase
MLKVLSILVTLIAFIASAAILVPAPNMALFPLTVLAPEISNWLVIFDLVALALAASAWKPGMLFSGAALVVAIMVPVARGEFTPHRLQLVDIKPEKLPMNILFYKPSTEGVHPILIDMYGGGWQNGDPTTDETFNSYMAYHHGFATFAIDYRHAPQFKYPTQIQDVKAAIKFIHDHAAQYGADPNHIVLSGRSAGGQLALLAAYDPDGIPIRAVIAFYPPVDLAAGYNDPPAPDPLKIKDVLTAYIGGTPAQLGEHYKEASAVTYATRHLPPTLIIQGLHDHIVKPKFAEEFVAKSKAAGNHVELLEIPYAEHAFDYVFEGSGNQLAINAIEKFLGPWR